MAELKREALIKRPFNDRKNYPYGFARSGDFSIKEAKVLTESGTLIAALVDGKLAPESESEMRYIGVAHGQVEASTPEEKVWLKYQKRINRPKAASIYGSKKVAVAESDEDMTPDDTDLVLADE